MSQHDESATSDSVEVRIITGHGTVKVIDADGNVVEERTFTNIITQVGDQYYFERGAGIAAQPAQVTGMKLGTGTTTPAKTGAGAALVTYLTDSHQAIDSGYPASSLVAPKRRIQWRTTWAAGKATTSGTNIGEVVMINDTLANATTAAANTISRALISPTLAKSSTDALEVTWNHDGGT